MKNCNLAAFAATFKDKNVLLNSSSGGVFYSIAYETLTEYKGVVYGATMVGTNVFHTRIDDVKLLPSLTKSKYVISEMRNCFAECLEDLRADKNVFFVGTPCQIYALKKYLDLKGMSKEKLLTADFICHGAPKKKYFDLYFKEAFPNAINPVIDFKYKKPSWENYSFLVKYGKKEFVESHETNTYFNAFLGNYILLDSCYNCSFKGENRYSDITLGDFWGCSEYYPEFYNKNGTSLIVIRNKRELLLQMVKKHCEVNEVDYHLSLKNNESYFISSKKPKDYDECHKSVESIGFLKTFETLPQKYNCLTHCFKNIVKKMLFSVQKRPALNNKCVGIITDHGYFNFGNRLQNYALRTIIEKEGFRSFNLFFDKSAIIRKAVYLKYRFFKNKQIDREYSIYRASKKSGEKDFFYDYSIDSKKKIYKSRLVLLGSDQIWNTDYNRMNLYYHLGCFGINKKMNISSYAASFGVKKIPNRFKQLFFDKLSKASSVGVRETEGIELLSEIGIQSKLNLDPVLLLSAAEWEKSFDYCTKFVLPRNYIFKYILDSEKNIVTPKAYANLYQVDILDEQSSFFVCNHFDFVKFIQRSELVISNSFHALVFSIIFKKKIYITERDDDMMSRFTSIFNILGISNFLYTVIDFSKVDISRLDSLRLESLLFLNNILFNKKIL